MTRRTSQAMLWAAGMSLSLVVLLTVAWARTRDVVVPRRAVTVGIVTTCAHHGVDSAALGEAATWWAGLGHPVAMSLPPCDLPVRVDLGLEDHGRTHVVADRGMVVSADIVVRPSAGPLVLAHELGHALGYLHPRAAPTGHLMHPHHPGWDGRGLEAP